MGQRAIFTNLSKSLLAAAVLAIGSSAWAENRPLTLDPFAAVSGQSQRAEVLLATPSTSGRSVLYLDAQTAPASGSQTLPPVNVSGQGQANPGNLHLLPDTRELEAAPYRQTLFS